MARPLGEIRALSRKYACPILYAGDIFDRWNAGPDIINFALAHLPRGYAVPGQHDLPNHNYGEMDRSAYGVLVRAGCIENIAPGERVLSGGHVWVTGFPWGFTPKPLNTVNGYNEAIEVALIHKFVWIKGCGYPGADDAARVSTKALAGYHVAAYGDNHMGFIVKPTKKDEPWVINCGGFMRRKSDEKDYRPGIGLVLGDGSVVRHYLNTDGEKITTLTAAEEAVGQTLNMSAFVDELKTLGSGDALDFGAAMRKFFDHNRTRKPIRDVITEAMSNGV